MWQLNSTASGRAFAFHTGELAGKTFQRETAAVSIDVHMIRELMALVRAPALSGRRRETLSMVIALTLQGY